MVVSDYAGVDLHENQGNGHFVDITEKVLPERHLFGMAHTLADFDRDGLTDIYAIGMSSTTARRLDRLGLGREDRPDIHRMRGAMGSEIGCICVVKTILLRLRLLPKWHVPDVLGHHLI